MGEDELDTMNLERISNFAAEGSRENITKKNLLNGRITLCLNGNDP